MHQEINLYQPVESKQHTAFSAATIVQALSAVMLMLLVILAHTHWTLSTLNTSAIALQNQHDLLASRITMLQIAEADSASANTEDEVKQLHDSINQRNKLLLELDSTVHNQRAPYSEIIKAILASRLDGVILDEIYLESNGIINILGNSRNASTVPGYLQQLNSNNTLSDTHFGNVRIFVPHSDSPDIRFELRSRAGEKS